MVTNDLSLHGVEPSGNKPRLKYDITFILTVCCSSQRIFYLGSVCWTDPQFDHKAATSTTRRYPTSAPSDGGRHTSDLGHTAKSPCPVCSRYVTSRGVSWSTRCSGWVHVKCSGLLNAAQYRRNKDWTGDPCSASRTHQSTTPPPSPSSTPAASAEQISDDSTFNVLQFNTNGIGNKLT